jgi:sec-independent protein translocase protein TatA
MRLGPTELILILVIVLIVFGAGKLPQVGGAIGKGIREFRKASHGDYDEEDGVKSAEAKQVSEPATAAKPTATK